MKQEPPTHGNPPPTQVAEDVNLASVCMTSVRVTSFASPCQDDAINFHEHVISPHQNYTDPSYHEVLDEGCSLYIQGNTYIITDKLIDITPDTFLEFGFMHNMENTAGQSVHGIALIPEEKFGQAEHKERA